MDISENHIDRWLERGGKFFKTVSRNPVVRGALLARGLTDEELGQGWQLYTALLGFGGKTEARATTQQTAAAQAINELDAWDAPSFGAAHAVLDARYPDVSQFLFQNLEATTGVAAVVGVERFLDRYALLRDGNAPNVNAEQGKLAAGLLSTRKIVDPTREQQLRALIATARLGARSEEVAAGTDVDPRREEVAAAYVNWLNEWREVARVAIARRDYRISLGLAQRRKNGEDDSTGAETGPAATTAATSAE
jgi:hypothetical protein